MCRETSKGRYCETVQCRWNRSLYERTVSSDPVVLGIQGCTVANLKITPDDYKRLEPLELCKKLRVQFVQHCTGIAEVMDSNPVQVCIEVVYNCDDQSRFHVFIVIKGLISLV